MFGQRRSRLTSLISAALLFGVITAARYLVANPVEGIGLLYVIPVALLAVEYRLRGGLGGALVAAGLTGVWGFTQHVPMTALGYGARAGSFVAVALVIAMVTGQRERHQRDAERWFSMATDLLCTASLDGYFVALNESWERVLGYSRDELLGHPYVELVHPDDVAATNEVAAGLSDPSSIANFANRYRAKDGSWRWLLWSARSDDERIYAVAKDITSRKLAEQEREQFVALVSHELRTPLTSILGYIETALDLPDGELSSDAQRFLGVAQRNGLQLERLVDDLLLAAQIDAGTLSVTTIDCDVSEVAAQSVEAARPAAAASAIELHLDAPHPAACKGDPGRLGQALDNLVSNAIKFTPSGGTVTVSVAAGASVQLAVRDTGVGIPEREQHELFTRFFRASSAGHVRGIGLGLSIVRAIVQAHGGTIDVDSREGEGSTFLVELPAPGGSADPASSVVEPALTAGAPT